MTMLKMSKLNENYKSLAKTYDMYGLPEGISIIKKLFVKRINVDKFDMIFELNPVPNSTHHFN